MQQLAEEFAREQLLPHASKWDEQKTFPVDVLKQAAQLGFAGLSTLIVAVQRNKVQLGLWLGCLAALQVHLLQ